jgi:hypothetical protein
MGVRFELHELLFEVAANVVVVPDDGVNEEVPSSTISASVHPKDVSE